MALHIDTSTGRQSLPKDSMRQDDSQNQRGHPQSSSIPPPLPPLRHPDGNNDKTATALRKYLVLLQDCLAIKFSPIVDQHHNHECPSSPDDVDNEDDDDYLLGSHGSPRIIVSNGGSTAKHSSNSIFNEHSDPSRHHQHHQLHNCTRGNVSFNNDVDDNNGEPRRYMHLQNRPLSVNLNGVSYMRSSSSSSPKHTEVDHSLQALFLYKGFKEANAQCTWNPALTATFQNIQYKGYIVPYTILVGSSVPKFLSILRTAWSRQMLKSPKGYRIEFIGEIEEVIADPIQKGQFAPLSDALCWVILELTSLGQEAFVDSIISTLQLSFPTMSCPSRELVFQTLEKLIKERKVYQTSRGYFVVTPEIFRYMVSANFHEAEWTSTKNKGGEMTLDALMHPNSQGLDKSSFSNPSWEAAGECDHNPHHSRNLCSSTPSDDDVHVGTAANLINSSPKLKRHNSLKLIRQRDAAVNGPTRRYSFRLPKSKSCGRMNDADNGEEVVERSTKAKSSTMGHISRAMRSLRYGSISPESGNCEEGNIEKGKKHKSLLSKFFPFRRRSSSKNRSNGKPSSSLPDQQSASGSANISKSSSSSSASEDGSKSPHQNPPTKTKHAENSSVNKNKFSAKLVSTQTQTSHSTEQLCVPSVSIPGSGAVPNGKTSGRMMTADARPRLSPEQELPEVDLNLMRHMRPDPGSGSHQTRSSSRRSMSILDESPLYDVLQDESSPSCSSASRKASSQLSPNFQVGCPVGPSILSGYQNHRVPSRCSTLSSQAVSSLGYGSNGHPSLNSNCNCNPNNMDGGLVTSSSNGAGYYDYAHSPTKRNQYSSSNYKNSCEWWRKRYPNYVSPLGRSSPLYASLTAPRSKSRSRPTYESLLTPATVSPQVPGNDGKNGRNVSGPDNNVTTSTITQAVKSTTNMEMQLLLPLGKIMTAALQAKKDAIKDAWLRDELGPGYAAYANKNNTNPSLKKNDNDENQTIQINLDSSSGAKLMVGEPTTRTEITTVVNNNGLIETKFDTNSDPVPPSFKDISSTLEIKTIGGFSDIGMVNGKTNGEMHKDKRASKSPFTCSKMNDISKDCGTSNKDLIKAC